MKSWRIFAVGITVVIAALFLQSYESAIAGVGALVIVGMVGASKFLTSPR